MHLKWSHLNFTVRKQWLLSNFVVYDPKQKSIDQLLDKIYELYADFALKNPFYSLEMPIRADLFDQNLQVAIDQIERTGFIWHSLSSNAHFIVLHSINKYTF